MEKKVIKKSITNNENDELYVGDALIYEIKGLKDVGITGKCKVFRSTRYLDDLPTVFEFGKKDETIQKCSKFSNDVGTIISDSLTILKTQDNAVFIAYMGGKEHLIRTEIKVDKNFNFINLRVYAEIDKIILSKETFELEPLEIFSTNNVNETIKDFAQRKTFELDVRNKKIPQVFATGNYYGHQITFDDCLINLEKIIEYNLDFNVFQIDEGWEKKIGVWENKKSFPKLKEMGKIIKGYGLTAGLWTSPFIACISAQIWKANPSWILKDTNGKPIVFIANHHLNYIVDVSIPATWNYLTSLYDDLKEKGFLYHKIDYTYAFLFEKKADYHNKSITPIKAYRNAFLAIRKGIGDESFLFVSNGLFDPLIGIADAQSSSSACLSMWENPLFSHKKEMAYAIKQNLLRYYMNYWWYNASSSLCIRENKRIKKGGLVSLGLLNDNEIRTAVLNQLASAGLIEVSEPLDKISFNRLANLTHLLPIKDVEIEIVKLLENDAYPIIRLIEKGKGNRCFAIIMNLSNKAINPKLIVQDLAWNDLKLNEDNLFMVSDFYGNKIYRDLHYNDEIELEIKPHASTILTLSMRINAANFEGHFLTK